MKNIKKILAVVLSVAMVIGSISSTALAKLTEIGDEGNNLTVYYYNEEGTQIGTEYYGSTENFDRIFSGKPYGAASVKILPNDDLYEEDLQETLIIPEGEDVIFDLAGNDINASAQLFEVAGALTIIDSDGAGEIAISGDHEGDGTVVVLEEATLTTERVTINSTAEATPVIYNGGTFVAKASDDGVPMVTGIITGDALAAYKMSAGYYSAAAGAYNSYLDTTIERTDIKDTVEFEHIADTSGTNASKIAEKTLVASLGEYNYYSVGTALDDAEEGDVVQLIVNHTENIVSDSQGTLDLNGHALTGSINAASLDITDSQSGGSVSGTVVAADITGGAFASTVTAANVSAGTFESAVTATSITGGRFKAAHATIASGYADGTPEGGYTPVIEKRIVKNLTTDVIYGSLQAAVTAAASGEVLKLIDTPDDAVVVIGVGKNVTIDTAGFKVDGSVTNYGSLTVIDSVNVAGSLEGSFACITNDASGTVTVSGAVKISTLVNEGAAIKIASDITGSTIGISWDSLNRTCFATDISGSSLDLSSYIGTIFVESYEGYEMIVKGTSLYLVSATIDSVSMTLANELAMNYYCTVPTGMLSELGDKIILEITCEADAESTQYIEGSLASVSTVSKTDEITGAAKDFDQYIFKFDGIDPTWMSSDITARLYLGKTTQTFEAEDAYDESVYSVAEYCNDLYGIIQEELDNPGTNPNPNISSEDMQLYYNDMKTLVANILMYGKTAQIYRDVATDALCTQVRYEYNEGERSMVKTGADLSWITTNYSSDAPTAADDITCRYAKNTNLSGLAVNGSAIKIAGATCMFGKGGFIAPRFFIAADAADIAAGNVAVRICRYNEAGVLMARKVVALDTNHVWGQYYYVELGGADDTVFQFYPQDFDQKITAEVLVTTSAGAARTLQKMDYSINSYCTYWYNAQGNEAMTSFALATFNYGKATQALYDDLY